MAHSAMAKWEMVHMKKNREGQSDQRRKGVKEIKGKINRNQEPNLNQEQIKSLFNRQGQIITKGGEIC